MSTSGVTCKGMKITCQRGCYMLGSKSYNSRRMSHVKKRELHVKESVASMKGVPCKEVL